MKKLVSAVLVMMLVIIGVTPIYASDNGYILMQRDEVKKVNGKVTFVDGNNVSRVKGNKLKAYRYGVTRVKLNNKEKTILVIPKKTKEKVISYSVKETLDKVFIIMQKTKDNKYITIYNASEKAVDVNDFKGIASGHFFTYIDNDSDIVLTATESKETTVDSIATEIEDNAIRLENTGDKPVNVLVSYMITENDKAVESHISKDFKIGASGINSLYVSLKPNQKLKVIGIIEYLQR